MEQGAGGAARVRERLGWVDLAKGLTMVLVVMAHSVGKHYLELDWVNELQVGLAWKQLNHVFDPMRMPLFFMLSGFLAAGSLFRDARGAYSRRVVNPYLLYLIWFCINAVFLAAFDFTKPEALTLSLSGLLRNLLFPHTTLWYMLALAGFFAAARVLRPLGVAVPILAAVALSTAVFGELLDLPQWTGMTSSMVLYFPLFLIGAYLPELPRRLALVQDRRVFLSGLVAYAVVAVAYRAGGKEMLGFGPLAAVVGAGTGILIAVRLAGLPRVARMLQGIGRRTLPIFVLHIPFLAVLHWLSTGVMAVLWAPMLGSTSAAILYPAIVTVANIATCLAVHASLQRVGMGWLFSLPLARHGTPSPERRRPPQAVGDA